MPEACPGFRSMKHTQVGVLLLPPGRDASSLQDPELKVLTAQLHTNDYDRTVNQNFNNTFLILKAFTCKTVDDKKTSDKLNMSIFSS